MKRPKYRNKKTEVNGITFDSRAEADYYEMLQGMVQCKEIASFTVQPKYELQPPCVRWGKKMLPIVYKADFEIVHLDGSLEVVDVKGMPTETALLKFKLFQYRYPDLRLTLLQKRGGAFVEMQAYQKQRRAEKRQAKKEGK